MLNLIRDAADFYEDESPFQEYFLGNPDVVTRILKRIDERERPEEIARGLLREILGEETQRRPRVPEGRTGFRDWPNIDHLLPTTPTAHRTPQPNGGPETPAKPIQQEHKKTEDAWFEVDIREFFASLGLKQVALHSEPWGYRLTVERDGRKLEISLFLKKTARPYFRTTRFYKVAYKGTDDDTEIVEKTVRFIAELEMKARRDGFRGSR